MRNVRMPRVDFTQSTKGLIAARAGSRCSFPGCDRATIGPGAAPDQTASIGVAAHIFAASPGGPRGSGGLTDDELAQPQNGIWLCGNHARVVDTNQGNRFPPELLLSYKTLQEARISRELQGLNSPLGWIHEIRVCNSPIFSSGVTVRLAKLNLLVGNNNTGKTALCEWLAGFSELSYLKRWRRTSLGNYPIDVFLKLFHPDEKTLRLTVADSGHVEFQDDQAQVPMHAVPLRVLYPRCRAFHDTRDYDDLELMEFLLGLDQAEVTNLCPAVQSYEHSTVRNIRFEDDEDGAPRLIADVDGTVPGLPYDALSSREQNSLLIELASAAARTYARYAPTLLILDSSLGIFSEEWFKFYANHFSDTSSLFQTVVVIPTRDLDTEKLQWQGWEIIRTRGSIPDVTVEQTIRVGARE
jgi:hypothetical protein